MDTLLNILKGVAPTLATAVAGPAGGMAVGWIAKKLGIPDSTIEGVTAALAGNPEMTLKLKELDLEYAKLDAADRDSARNRETAIATNEHAPTINKIVTPVLALGVVSLSFVLFAVLIFVEVKPDAKDILIYILGVLSAAVTQILSYYFGSSQGSKDKSAEIEGMLRK